MTSRLMPPPAAPPSWEVEKRNLIAILKRALAENSRLKQEIERGQAQDQ